MNKYKPDLSIEEKIEKEKMKKIIRVFKDHFLLFKTDLNNFVIVADSKLTNEEYELLSDIWSLNL